MKKETIKAIAELGEEVAQAVIQEVTDEPEKEAEPEKAPTKVGGIVAKVWSVGKFLFRNKRVIALALSVIGLGGVAGGFTVVADTVCSIASCE